MSEHLKTVQKDTSQYLLVKEVIPFICNMNNIL